MTKQATLPALFLFFLLTFTCAGVGTAAVLPSVCVTDATCLQEPKVPTLSALSISVADSTAVLPSGESDSSGFDIPRHRAIAKSRARSVREYLPLVAPAAPPHSCPASRQSLLAPVSSQVRPGTVFPLQTVDQLRTVVLLN